MGKLEKRVYNDPKWKKTLLETPSGFALFEVSEAILKEPEDIWVYFRDVKSANKYLVVLGFVKFDDKSTPWDSKSHPSKDLVALIQNFCDDRNPLYVQHSDLVAVITEQLNVKCLYDSSIADEVTWGLKYVLGDVIPEEKDKTMGDTLPMSKGLKHFLQDNLINVPLTMFNAEFMSKMGLAQYLNITIKQVSKILRSYDEYVLKIGESIKNDQIYARVLAKILVPELAPDYDLSKILSPELAKEIPSIDRNAATCRDKKLKMHDRETIVGGLYHFLAVPQQRDDIMTRIKLMEGNLRKKQLGFLKDTDDLSMSNMNLETSLFKRVLLETPSGFAIFDVREDVFTCPMLMWLRFTDESDFFEAVLALGFVKVPDKSVVRSSDGPGEELTELIKKLCAAKSLIVQDDKLKSVIEKELDVKCYPPINNNGLDEIFWGLKYVLHEFIPEEAYNITSEYYNPFSEGMEMALNLYKISPEKMDGDFIFILARLRKLDLLSEVVPFIFRRSFDSQISRIGELIEDDAIYIKVAAQILVPESQHKIDFFELLSSDLAKKAADIAKSKAESGEVISVHDKNIILTVIEYFSTLDIKRQCFLNYLKRGSEEDVQSIKQKCNEEAFQNHVLLHEWVELVEASMVEEQGDAEEAKKTGETEVSNAEKTPPEVEAMDKIKSSEEVFGIVETQKRLEPSSKTDYLEIPKEEGSVDGHNYRITVGGKAILNAVGPDAVAESDIDEKMQHEDVLEGKDNVENMKQNADNTSSSPLDQIKMARSTNVVAEENKEQDADTTKGPASNGTEGAHNTDVEGRTEGTTSDGDQSEATTEDPRSGENNMLPCTDKENKEQNANTIKGPASDENNAAQKTDVEGGMEGTAYGIEGVDHNEEITASGRMEGTAYGIEGVDHNEEITASGRIPSSLRDLFSSENMQTKVLGYDQKTHTTEDIIEIPDETKANSEDEDSTKKTKANSEDEDSTKKTKANSEDEDSTKNRSNKKKTRIKNWPQFFMRRSSKDNGSRSSKDNLPPVKECSTSGSTWRFFSTKTTSVR